MSRHSTFKSSLSRRSMTRQGANLFVKIFSGRLLCAVMLCAAITAVAQSSPNEPLPAGAAKEKAEAACLTCHEGRIIVQQRLTKAAWTKEVDKMIKWGAEVDAKDRDALIDYFSTNFGTDQPAFEAPRTPAGSKSKTGKGR